MTLGNRSAPVSVVLDLSPEEALIHINNFTSKSKLMERESLTILYRRALANVKKNQIDID